MKCLWENTKNLTTEFTKPILSIPKSANEFPCEVQVSTGCYDRFWNKLSSIIAKER